LTEDLCHAVITRPVPERSSHCFLFLSSLPRFLSLSPTKVRARQSMSGKVPPRGPRALLGSLPPSTPHANHQHQQQPQQQQNQPASSSSSSAQPQRVSPTSLTSSPNKRIGAVPPTGPRSLNGRLPPPGPKHLLNGHSNLGLSIPSGSHGLQSNRHPISIKGKNPDKGLVGARSSSSVWK
jgi:hypothetical protein